MKLNIIYEDQHIIVVDKPPKVPSQGDPSGDKDMLTLLRDHLIEQNPKNKDPYIAVVHRLDRPVGGIMVFPKTKYACAELNREIQNKEMKKSYYCVTCSIPEEKNDRLINYLKRIKSLNMSKVVNEGANTAKEAILEYSVLGTTRNEEYGDLALLKINLITGRHHQIRLQLSHHGYPLWGDRKYNKGFGRGKGWTQIALYAGELTFKHPKTKKDMTFNLEPPNVTPFNLFS